MTFKFTLGPYNAGPYCGSGWWPTLKDVKYYGLFRRIRGGFSILQILFWRNPEDA